MCVFCSPPEPRVRYGVLPGEWVGGEYWPWQERELDVHPEWQHAGETLLHRLGLLPTVSFIHSSRVQRAGASLSWVATYRACLSPDSLLRYDHETQHAFVGDYSGQITLLKLERQTYSTITTLKGHEGKGAHCTHTWLHMKDHPHRAIVFSQRSSATKSSQRKRFAAREPASGAEARRADVAAVNSRQPRVLHMTSPCKKIREQFNAMLNPAWRQTLWCFQKLLVAC